MARWADHPVSAWLLGLLALAFAAASAKPFAASWNDGSRLASIESLIERGTFCIDQSVFLHPVEEHFVNGTPPYDPNIPLLRNGTLDRLYIDGHWYSDKPPLVSLPLAGAYLALMELGLPAPSARPDLFVWVMTVLLSGLGYAVAVGCMWRVGKHVGLSPGWRLAWLAAFALATVLPAYTRSVNNHIAQLGAVAAVCVLLCRIAECYRCSAYPTLDGTRGSGDLPLQVRDQDESRSALPLTSPLAGEVAERSSAGGGRAGHHWFTLLALGFLTGFAYNLDYGIGPPLTAAVMLIVAFRTRSLFAIAICGFAMLPCIVAGHAINYSIGGDWLKPLNMHREYLAWPGSPFATTMTGILRDGPVDLVRYSLDLLVGKNGFLTHNLPLMLAITAGALVLRRSARDRVELLVLLGWCVSGWLLYGALSTNRGGGCVSIRWFVPLLAPGFWLLAKVLVKRPEFRRDFVLLSTWGLVISAGAWSVGTWHARNVPLYWWCFGGSLATWGVLRYLAWGAKGEPSILKFPMPGKLLLRMVNSLMRAVHR